MALRAFQANPSIGGFGGESLFGRLPGHDGKRPNAAERGRHGNPNRNSLPLLSQANIDPTNNSGGKLGAGSCDAFAQIVKELVDNAVDACAQAASNDSDRHEDPEEGEKTMKRVRVTITSTEVPVRLNANDNDPDTSVTTNTETMDCLRIDISDNGCGMENIDECVTAFRSNKNGAAKQCDNPGDGKRREKSEESTKSKALKKSGGKKQNFSEKQTSLDSKENYTSGRYGVGLTLCLLHAQRLCPGTGACITSATASADEWTRATYEPDTGADNIVCKKKESFPKEIEGECGTTISLLVPGGEDAQRAWPRLAEYFSRFQLSIDLSCSLEVKAPTLQSRPLYVRPPSEMERRIHRKMNVSLATDSLKDESDANNESNERSNKAIWKGGDGFDEGNSPEADGNHQEPKTSKASRQRAETELQKKKKTHLICKAASAYKGRPDLEVENVAYTTQPIRRNTGSGQSAESGPILEIGFVVFGPAGNVNDDSEHETYPQNQNGNNRSNQRSSSKLQVVRMVNGIPLLDSPEALACGVVQKIANNAATWNSFGLTLLQNSENDLEPVPVNERNTPTFEIKDSDQVAPFLKSTAHSLFQGEQSQDFGQPSDDSADFDIENMRGKRKKERQVRSILPVHQRLGDVLMLVQIRAKPSALPLPTLSKGRLPLNDKGISDALDNGISDCLRLLQRSSPGLLLTAHQLKRVERDVKYVPSVAGAIASVLCRSEQRGDYMNIASDWDEQVKKMGASYSSDKLETVQRRGRFQSNLAENNNPMKIQANEERLRVDALRPILERRLRFVVSDKFKDAKKSGEREKQRREREEIAATKKRTKKSKAVEPDGMKSDCFESDGDGSIGRSSAAELSTGGIPMKSSQENFDIAHTRRHRCRGGSISSSAQSSVACFRGDPQKPFRDDFDSDMSSLVQEPRDCRGEGSSAWSVQSSASGSRGGHTKPFTDNDMSSPVLHAGRHRRESNPAGSSDGPSVRDSQVGPEKPPYGDIDSDTNNPVRHTGRHHWKRNLAGVDDCPRRDSSTQKTSCDDFIGGTSSPGVQSRQRQWSGKSEDEFDDGYESSPRLSDRLCEGRKSVSTVRGHRDKNARFQSYGNRPSVHSPEKPSQHYESSQRLSIGRLEDERGRGLFRCGYSSNVQFTHSPDKSACHDDGMSSDSEWSSEYGEVVPGHFFR